MKIKYPSGLLLVLALCALLVPSQAQAEAEPRALEWAEVDKPGLTGNVVVSPSEVSEITIGQSGTFYGIESSTLPSGKVYRSQNAGATWEDITLYLDNAGAGLPASKITVAPDKAGTLAVVTNANTKVYLSTDDGVTWTDTNVPGLTGTIQVIAMSKQYTEGGTSVREIAIGTANWGDNITTGQVRVFQVGRASSWQDQNLTVDPGHTGGEVSAIAYSPNYRRDKTMLVVASTSSDVAVDYQSKTWLCIGKRNTTAGTTSWNSLTGYPAEVGDSLSPSAGDGDNVTITSSLSLPSNSNYSPSTGESPELYYQTYRRVFVSYDRQPDANDDVYHFSDNTTTRLNVAGGISQNISSIAYYGTVRSGMLLAGEVSPIGDSKTVQVWRTDEPFKSPPTWYPSTVPPTGPGNAKLSWSPDGKVAYCGTSQSPGDDLGDDPDESAFSTSSDTDNWQQLSLMDTVIKFSDISPSPDSKNLFAATYSSSGPEGIWRSASTRLGLGKVWSRQLTMNTDSDKVILRLSPNYSTDYTIYVAEVGGDLMAVSHTRGNSWKWQRALGQVIDMLVEDEDTIYVALPNGQISKSITGARTWRGSVDTDLSDINMLAMTENGHILVGGRKGDVAYSTDGGRSFNTILEVIGSGTGDVQVVADANYSENGIIYTATDLPDEGIWRWTIGSSTKWEQIDKSITELGNGQRISGLAVGPEGTLYALRLEAVASTNGGMTRSLNSSNPDPTEVEFDFTNYLLPEGTTFDPNVVFANTLPYLKLSGDSGQNELWAVDTANQIIYRFQDTLCKVGPMPDIPAAEATIPIGSAGYTRNLRLGWDELSGATLYQAAIYSDSAGTQELWSETGTTVEIIATVGAGAARLISGTTYYWRVRSTEPIKSPWSEIRSFTPALGGTRWSPLTAFTIVSPSAGATNVSIRPAFTWNPADRATAYEFVLARDSEFTDVVVALTGDDALPTNVWGCDRELDYAATYFWKVRAISATSQSEWGTSVFTTRAAIMALAPPQSSPPQSSPPPPPPPEPMPLVPSYLPLVMTVTGIILVVGLAVLIVRTGG